MSSLEVRILSRPAFWVAVAIILLTPRVFVWAEITDPVMVIPLICLIAIIGSSITWHWIMVPTLNWNKTTDYGGILLMILTGLALAVVATPIALIIKFLM